MIFDWALNRPWVLEFEDHWGTGAQVIKGTKCRVIRLYTFLIIKLVVLSQFLKGEIVKVIFYM